MCEGKREHPQKRRRGCLFRVCIARELDTETRLWQKLKCRWGCRKTLQWEKGGLRWALTGCCCHGIWGWLTSKWGTPWDRLGKHLSLWLAVETLLLPKNGRSINRLHPVKAVDTQLQPVTAGLGAAHRKVKGEELQGLRSPPLGKVWPENGTWNQRTLFWSFKM